MVTTFVNSVVSYVTKSFYFILGALLPLPIFYDFGFKSFLIYKMEGPICFCGQLYYLLISNFIRRVPVPIGFFVIFVIALILPFVSKAKLSSEYKYRMYISSILSALFFIIIMTRIPQIERVLSLFFPFFLLYVLCYMCLSKFLLPSLLKGYVFSLLFMSILHFVSIVNCVLYNLGSSSEASLFLSLLLCRDNVAYFYSFFGYAIYQALVSYSAVLSFLFCTIVIFMLNSKGRLKCLLLSLVSTIIFYVVLSGGRKAAMVDMLITFSLYIYYIIRNAKYVTKSKVAVILSVLFLSVIGIYVGIVKGGGLFSTLYREVFFSRGMVYANCVLEIAKRSFIEIFTGSVIYWSSQHNILLAFLYQIGLFGVIVFLLAFSYFVNSLLLILKQRFSNISKKNGTLCKDVKMWATFAFYSFISSNMFNSNFQLPYFVINVSFISLCYLYFYKDSSVMVTTKLGPLER